MSSTEEQTFKEDLLNREDAGRRTFAHEPGEGEAWWWFGVLATIKATAEQTDGRYALVEILAPDGYGSVLHVHHFEDEGFYILEGEMTFYVGEQTIKARPGSYLFGPKDVPHAFTVDSGPAKLLFVARGTGSRHQGNGRASEITDSAAPAGGAARRSRDGAVGCHRRPVWSGDPRSAAWAVETLRHLQEGPGLLRPAPSSSYPLFTGVRGRGILGTFRRATGAHDVGNRRPSTPARPTPEHSAIAPLP
jgi:mannose-6-phosphate isomerase-like protein (cupin superfamily)